MVFSGHLLITFSIIRLSHLRACGPPALRSAEETAERDTENIPALNHSFGLKCLQRAVRKHAGNVRLVYRHNRRGSLLLLIALERSEITSVCSELNVWFVLSSSWRWKSLAFVKQI